MGPATLQPSSAEYAADAGVEEAEAAGSRGVTSTPSGSDLQMSVVVVDDLDGALVGSPPPSYGSGLHRGYRH